MPSPLVAARRDATDPLAPFRERFVVGAGPIYLDGNSLGRMPRATVTTVRNVLTAGWGERVVGGWEEWLDLPQRVGDLIATSCLGAAPGETVVADSVTVNLFKAADAAVALQPGRSVIITEAEGFPTDRYILTAVAQRHGWEVRPIPHDAERGVTVEALAAAMDDAVGLVALSHVDYRSGALADAPALTAVAHAAGALMIWDLSHSVGVVPIHLGAWSADFAVGCTYKYLNGGPGAPAFIWVHPRLIADIAPALPGWFGHGRQFAMEEEYEPAAGVARFLTGTPPIVSLAAVETGAAMVAAATVDAIRSKSSDLTQFLIECADEELSGLGFTVATPRTRDERGAHVALRHPEAWRICRALIAHGLVVPDFREPDFIRLGPAPLYTTYADVQAAIGHLGDVVRQKLYADQPQDRTSVT